MAANRRQKHGIEINPIAHDLASIVVWIGYIQWQQNNGYLSFKDPLTNIRQMDAILAFDEEEILRHLLALNLERAASWD